MDPGLRPPGGLIKALFPMPLWASAKKRDRCAPATAGRREGRRPPQPISAAKAGCGTKPPKSAKPEASAEAASTGASTKQ